jgi:hypothetical protein
MLHSKIRVSLATGILDLIGPQYQADSNGQPITFRLESAQIAAIIGGALDQALTDTFKPEGPQRVAFFQNLNHNLMELTRTLRASNLLEKLR